MNLQVRSCPEGVHLDVFDHGKIWMEDNSRRNYLKLRCSNDPEGTTYGDRMWIQGMGDTRGLLSMRDCCRNERKTQLLCYSTNDVLRYENEESVGCWILTANEELSINAQKAKIGPNPTSNKLVINFSNSKHKKQLKIYSSDGQQIQSYKDILGESFVLDLKQFPTGVYFLEISSLEMNIEWHKIMKIEE